MRDPRGPLLRGLLEAGFDLADHLAERLDHLPRLGFGIGAEGQRDRKPTIGILEPKDERTGSRRRTLRLAGRFFILSRLLSPASESCAIQAVLDDFLDQARLLLFTRLLGDFEENSLCLDVGMPTQVAGGGNRQSLDCIGTIDGASITQLTRFFRFTS